MNGQTLDPEWVAELTLYANGLRMALAEAGYPNAEVEIGWSGVFVTGAPSAVIAKAADICSGINPDRGTDHPGRLGWPDPRPTEDQR